MMQKLLTAAILSSMCFFVLANIHHDEEKISIETITNEGNLLFDQNEVVERFSTRKKLNGMMHYSIGARRAADRLVASGGQNQSWPQSHNAQIALTYPPSGVGASVTYVAIVVNQTSNLGQAYVTKGGINPTTLWFSIFNVTFMVFRMFKCHSTFLAC